MDYFKDFPLRMGDTVFNARFGINIGCFHMELTTSDKKPAFFSNTGYHSHFYGYIDKQDREEAKKTVDGMNEEKVIELIKKIAPNYPLITSQNPLVKQLSFF